MSLSIERARTKRRVTWLTVIGIILLPVLVGGVLVAALWNPTDRLDNIRAAIVNQDEPVTIEDQLVPLGRQLTAGLVEGSDDVASNVDWVISNPDDAKDGLADGTYQAAIMIPKEFSAAATSTAGDDPKQATIDVVTSHDARVFDDVITTQIADIATNTMGRELSKTYLENVLLGFTTLNEQLGTAADGAGELADGAKKSTDGTKKLADGATELADGAGQAAAGTHELANGATELANGAGQAATGTHELAGGAGQLADGAKQSADGAGALAGGASQLSSGARQSADGAGALANGLSQLAPGAKQLADGTGSLANQTGAFADGATQLAGGLTQTADGARQAVTGLQSFEQQVRDGAATAGSSQMIPQELLDNAASAADGSIAVVHTLVGTADDPQANPGGVAATLGGSAQAIGGDAENLGALAAECFAAGTDAAFCQRIADSAASVGQHAQSVGAAAGEVGAAAAQAGDVARATGTANGYAQGTAEALPAQIEQQLNGIADGIHQVQVGPDGTSGVALLAASLETIAGTSGELADGATRIDGGVKQLAGGAGALSDGLGQSSGGASKLASGVDQLATGASGLADGSSKLASGVDQLASGASGLADGSSQLAAGADQLAAGTSGLADGASRLATGADQLAAGTTGIADGTKQLFDGSKQLATGADGLATGLDDAVKQIPTYSKEQRTTLADVVANPVSTGSEATTAMFGGAAIPLLAILALWFGSLASYVAIQAVSRRALASRAPSFLLALKSFLPGAAIGAVQGVLLAGIVQFATKYDTGEWFAFAGLAALAGIAFAAVNQALVALFGGTGRWISAIIGVVFFATGVVSTTPGWLTGIAGMLPTGPAFRSLLTVVTPADGTAAAVTSTVLWLVAGLVLTTIAVARHRSTSAKGLRVATA